MTKDGSNRRDARADALAEEFGPRSTTARRAVATLYHALADGRDPHADAAMLRWQELSADLGGSGNRQRSAKLNKIAGRLGLPEAHPDPAALLFALDTYYVLLVKLISAETGDRIQPRPGDGASCLFHDPFAWYAETASPTVAGAIRDVAGKVARHASAPWVPDFSDVFGRLYQQLFPQGLRHGLGEYYTPDWLVEHVLDATGYSGSGDGRLLDPACGSGVFLLAAIRRIRAERDGTMESHLLAREILDRVAGFDLNPLAVMTARANYLLAIADLLGPEPEVEIPVYRRDAILDEPGPGERFDYVVGNPPWIAWDHLPAAYRKATAPLWRHYGLFSLSGTAARHGGGKKDLSMLVLYAAADRYLNDGGRLGFVITQTLLQTRGAGDGFRRFRLGASGEPLGVLRVDDMVRFQPFSGAANWTAVIVLEKGRETTYPVPYVRWKLEGRLPRDGDVPEGCFSREAYTARPIDPARPRSPWLVLPDGATDDAVPRPGPSDYVAHLGANSGGANGVYWVEILGRRGDGVLVRNLPARGKRAVEAVECVIEPDLLYPLLRWSDVAPYHARPGVWIILAQDMHSRKGIDEALMRDRYPRTLAYLTRFRDVLTDRAAYRRYQHREAFYSMYNVGPYTPAPIKVVWRRMDSRIRAAAVEPVDDPVLGTRPVVAQETCVQLEVGSLAEAHYAAAVLNSRAVNLLVAAHSVRGGKGFGSPGMLDYVNLRRFDPENPVHAALAEAGAAAHRLAAAGENVTACQEEIDRLACELRAMRIAAECRHSRNEGGA